jgi:UPF0755 protein
MNKKVRYFFSALLCSFLIAAAGAYYATQYLDEPMAIGAEGLSITLNRGDSLTRVAVRLHRLGALGYPKYLVAYSRLTGNGLDVKAGDYFLPEGISARQLLRKLEDGDVQYHEITLVEGWSLNQVLSHIQSQEKLQIEMNSNATKQLSNLLNRFNDSFEGLFFPDTYRYNSSTSDADILVQAYQKMQKVLQEEWQLRESGLPYENAYEALIMASLVEKETGDASERAQISGVFVRRLQMGMRLQTDPTVIYGLGEKYKGNLQSHHLKDRSNRYNTYRHNGLPPTPIALAGREAIHAALHPKKGDALYFVAKGDGTHYFSSNLKEHQQAVRKYQILQRSKNYTSAPKSNKNG